MLISALAKTAEISAMIPVKEKSSGPRNLIQDHSVSDLSESRCTDEEHTKADFIVSANLMKRCLLFLTFRTRRGRYRSKSR